MAAATPRIIVVGGGLAGLAAVIKIAEAGTTIDSPISNAASQPGSSR